MVDMRIASTCLAVLLSQSPFLVQASIWSVSIDHNPAPDPEDGPPFSAHASRDQALLPAQICGLIGAYVGTLVFTGGLLLTVGRRLRRQAQTVHLSIATEMVKPANSFGASPTSPGSQRSWYSPRRLTNKRSTRSSLKSDGNVGSPGLESNASFDFNVLEADKAARERELEDLYAAALQQEEMGSQSQTNNEVETLRVGPGAGAEVGASSPRKNRRPPRLLTTTLKTAHLRIPSNTDSPMLAKSPVRAIYPPGSPHHGYRSSPVSPINTDHPRTPLTPVYPPSPAQPAASGALGRHVSGSSLRSHVSGHGESKRFRKTLRNLHISAPIPKSPAEISDQEARTPLSPRYYPNPGAPPSPPTRSEAPTTPATYRSGSDEEAGHEGIDQIRALPMAAPQRRGEYQYHGVPPAVSGTSTSTLGTLPFRAMSNEQFSQSAQSPGINNTKLTYVERRRDLFNGPRTGAPTPYSPYMPFTPVTPVTPHLTSRAERKQKQKQQVRKAPAEEDRVLEEDEIWGSAY